MLGQTYVMAEPGVAPKLESETPSRLREARRATRALIKQEKKEAKRAKRSAVESVAGLVAELATDSTENSVVRPEMLPPDEPTQRRARSFDDLIGG